MKLKTLKAEREYWTKQLSEAESKKAKEVIEETLDELNYKIERKIMNKQWMIDMASYAAGAAIGTIIVNRMKK